MFCLKRKKKKNYSLGATEVLEGNKQILSIDDPFLAITCIYQKTAD